MLETRIQRIALSLVISAASGAALLGSLNPQPAQAEDHAWCMVQDDINRCDYASYQQCKASASGIGASCMGNPRVQFEAPARAAYAGAR